MFQPISIKRSHQDLFETTRRSILLNLTYIPLSRPTIAERRSTPSKSEATTHGKMPGGGAMGRKKGGGSPDNPWQEPIFPMDDVDPRPLQKYYVVWMTEQTDPTSGGSQFNTRLLALFQDRNTANRSVWEWHPSYPPQFNVINDIPDINGCAQLKLLSVDGTAVIHLKVTAVYCSPSSTDLFRKIVFPPLPGA